MVLIKKGLKVKSMMERVLKVLNEGKTIVFVSEEISDAVELAQNLIAKLNIDVSIKSFGSLYKLYLTDKAEMVKELSTSQILVIPDIVEIKDKGFWELLGVMLNSRIIEKKPTIIGTNLNIGNTPLLTIGFMKYYFDVSLIERFAEIIPIENPDIEETAEDIVDLDLDLGDNSNSQKEKEKEIDIIMEFSGQPPCIRNTGLDFGE